MGVIDLNARVRALEENAAGGAELDQIEAAVTALEETVNGNGETDLGLVGDVATLENELTATDLSTGLSGKAEYVTTATLYKYGNLYELRAVLSSAVPTSDWSSVLTLPEGSAPSGNVAMACAFNNVSDMTKGVAVYVQSNRSCMLRLPVAMTAASTLTIHATWIVIPSTES